MNKRVQKHTFFITFKYLCNECVPVSEKIALSTSEEQLIRANAGRITDLPPPPETWRWRDVDHEHGELQRWYRNGLLTKETHERARGELEWFQVRPKVYEYAQLRVERDNRFPCGCSGFTSVSEGVECIDHGYFYSPAEVREHL